MINEIVFNEDTELLDSPMSVSEFKLIPGAAEAVKILKEEGYLIFIITNQPAAAKGKTSLGKLFDINKKLTELIPEIDDVFMCPHHTEGDPKRGDISLIKICDCRKPESGLIEEACSKYAVDRSASFMAGDSFTDVQCGRKAGIQTVFIGSYKCDICTKLEYDKPDHIFKSLMEAATAIKKGVLKK